MHNSKKHNTRSQGPPIPHPTLDEILRNTRAKQQTSTTQNTSAGSTSPATFPNQSHQSDESLQNTSTQSSPNLSPTLAVPEPQATHPPIINPIMADKIPSAAIVDISKSIQDSNQITCFPTLVSEFDFASRIHGLTDQQKARLLPRFFDGIAKHEYSKLTAETQADYRSLVKELTKALSNYSCETTIMSAAESRIQGQNESFISFFTDLKKIITVAFPEIQPEYVGEGAERVQSNTAVIEQRNKGYNRTLLSYALRNCNPAIKLELRKMRINTPDQLLEHATHLENLTSPSHQPMPGMTNCSCYVRDCKTHYH
jgi:hypothetical protein